MEKERKCKVTCCFSIYGCIFKKFYILTSIIKQPITQVAVVFSGMKMCFQKGQGERRVMRHSSICLAATIKFFIFEISGINSAVCVKGDCLFPQRHTLHSKNLKA